MSIRKSKVNQKFYEIQGEFVFEGQRIRYHKSSLKDKNFMSKKWCEEEEERIINQKKKELLLEDYEKNFRDLEDEYLIQLKTDGARERTIQNVSYRMKNYYDKFFKKESKIEVVFNERNVTRFKAWISEFDYKADYKNLILTNFTQLVNYATDKKYISYETERSLLKCLKKFKNNDKKEEIHFYTPPEDAKKVWESASTLNMKNVIQLFYYSGCRISEFLAIQKKDVTFQKDEDGTLIAKVNISKQIFTQEGGIVPYLKNSSSNRDIYYLNDVAEVLKEYIKRNKYGNSDLLFNISKNSFRRELNKDFKKANVPHNTFHGFGRKSIATYLYLTTKDAKLPQILLGHKEVDMTLNTYVLNQALNKDLISQLGSIEKF